MGTIIELLIIAALVGGVMTFAYKAWEGFKEHIAAPYVQVEHVKVVAAEKRATDALAANETLGRDVDRIAEERKACSQSIDDWKALADRAATVAQQNRKTAESAIAQLRVDRTNSLTKAATAPTANESCEQILDEIDKDSKDLAERRAILFPGDKLKVGK